MRRVAASSATGEEARGKGVILDRQGLILRRLFARNEVLSVILYVHHQSVGTPGKNEAPAFVTTKCRRADHPHFAWKRIAPGDIAKVCNFTKVPGGKQRSLVRRGLLTNREASLGRGNGRQGGPPPGKGGGPPPGKGGNSDK